MYEVVCVRDVLSAVYYGKGMSFTLGCGEQKNNGVSVTRYQNSKGDYYKFILFRDVEVSLSLQGVQALFFVAGRLEVVSVDGNKNTMSKVGPFDKGEVVDSNDAVSFRLSTESHQLRPFSYVIGAVVVLMGKELTPMFLNTRMYLSLNG